MKKILLLLSVIVISITANASHFAGGELRYEFNGTNYTIKLALYGVCSQSSAPLQTSANVNVSSITAGASIPLTLNLVNFDSVNVGCPSMPNTCMLPSASIPGYVIANYSATVTLPSLQTDWIAEFSAGARSNSLNLSMPTATTMYLKATLNNSAAINSSPWVPNKPNYYAIVNQPLHIPLQIIDPEGDSTSYEIIPAMTAAATNVGYNTGYTATTPFGTGGTCTINANNVLTVKGTNLGMYVVALKVKDYRNGVLVGSYMREITVAVFPGTSVFTFPMPTSTSVFTVYTCPGQPSTVTVNFMDSTATDSVYLTVMPPTMTGWTFTPVITNGVASASTTISWTTPAGLNPATLPFFFIHIRARDNGCPRAVADYSILVRTRQCMADSVWPGDANGDFTVNIYDPLAIAIANGKTGVTRTGATTTWTAQACTNWGTTFVTNNTDIKHADCNGDGTINNTDLAAITSNWGSWHFKGTGGQNKTTGAPDLYFDLNGISLEPGKTVSIPIKLGTASSAVTDFYGLATVINISGMIPESKPVINTNTSWVGSVANTMNYTYSTTNNSVSWAYARTDQQNINGQGVIATVDVKIPSGAKVGDKIDFGFDMSKMIDKDGREISAFNELTTSGTITAVNSIANVAAGTLYLSVVPNPSHTHAHLNFALNNAGTINIKITDLVGKTIWQSASLYTAGSQSVELPADIATGLYLINVYSQQSAPQLIKWIKQ